MSQQRYEDMKASLCQRDALTRQYNSRVKHLSNYIQSEKFTIS